MEIARGDAQVGVQHPHPQHGAAGADEVVPLGGAGLEQLGMDPERIEVERRLFRGDLLEALVVDVVGKEQRARPLGDRRRLEVVSEDAARRGLDKIEERDGLAWLQGHFDYTTRPLLSEPFPPRQLQPAGAASYG